MNPTLIISLDKLMLGGAEAKGPPPHPVHLTVARITPDDTNKLLSSTFTWWYLATEDADFLRRLTVVLARVPGLNPNQRVTPIAKILRTRSGTSTHGGG